MKAVAIAGLMALWGAGLNHAHDLWTHSSEKERKQMMMAQLVWAERCLVGDGVEKDERMSVEWLRLAARNGSPEAFVRLAEVYRAGVVVDQDMALAHLYLELAAKLEPASDAGAERAAIERRMSTLEREMARELAQQFGGWKAGQNLPRHERPI